MSAHVLASLQAPIVWHWRTGAVNLIITGTEIASGLPVTVLFSRARVMLPDTPPRDMEIRQRDDVGGGWQIIADGIEAPVRARAVQVHRAATQAFSSALEPVRVAAPTRLGWTLLLQLLRVPGVGTLLARLRS